jgi:hypothetical protein
LKIVVLLFRSVENYKYLAKTLKDGPNKEFLERKEEEERDLVHKHKKLFQLN